VTTKAVRHARFWFENSQPSLGIFYALGNVTTTAINLVAFRMKNIWGEKLEKIVSTFFLNIT